MPEKNCLEDVGANDTLTSSERGDVFVLDRFGEDDAGTSTDFAPGQDPIYLGNSHGEISSFSDRTITADGNDRVRDSAPGEDLLDLRLLATVSGFEQCTIEKRGGRTTIDLTDRGGSEVTLQGVGPTDRDADDFINDSHRAPAAAAVPSLGRTRVRRAGRLEAGHEWERSWRMTDQSGHWRAQTHGSAGEGERSPARSGARTAPRVRTSCAAPAPAPVKRRSGRWRGVPRVRRGALHRLCRVMARLTPGSPRRGPSRSAPSSRLGGRPAAALRAGAGIALLLAAVVAALPSPARAQSQVNYVSSHVSQETSAGNHQVAQSFTTGSASGGYEISEIQLKVRGFSSHPMAGLVRIRENNSSNQPGDLVAFLIYPSNRGGGLRGFRAGPGTRLEPNTTYWVVVNDGLGNRGVEDSGLRVDYTRTDAESGRSGWSIGNSRLERDDEGTRWISRSDPLRMVVRGYTAQESRRRSDGRLSALRLEYRDGSRWLSAPMSPSFSSNTRRFDVTVPAGRSARVVMSTVEDDVRSVTVLQRGSGPRRPRSADTPGELFANISAFRTGTRYFDEVSVLVETVNFSRRFTTLRVFPRGRPPRLLRAYVGSRVVGGRRVADSVFLDYAPVTLRNAHYGLRPDGSEREGGPRAVPASAYTVTVDGAPATVEATDITANTVRLRLDRTVHHRVRQVTVSYDPPATNPLQSTHRGLAEAFADHPVEIDRIPGTGPGRGGATGTELLYGLMTVGDDTDNEYRGYNDGSGGEGQIGSLDRTGFRFDGADVTIRSVRHPYPSSVRPDPPVNLGLDREITRAEAANLDLYVNGSRFRFADANRWDASGGVTDIRWDSSGLSWTEGDRVGVLLVDANRPPAFRYGNGYAGGYWRSLYEHPRPDRTLGAVTATDADGHAVRHALEGRDARLFVIDSETGTIGVKAGVDYDYETEERSCRGGGNTHTPCYQVRVRATDSYGLSTSRLVQIELLDRDERGLAARNVRVWAPAGTNDELRVSWNAPGADERPESYRVFYNTRDASPDSWFREVVAGDITSVRLESLRADTLYRVRVTTRFADRSGADAPTVVKGTGSAGGPVARGAELLPDGRTVEVWFDEAIARTDLPDADDVFTVTVDGAAVGVASAIGAVEDEADRVRLELEVDRPIRSERTVRVRYEAQAAPSRALRNTRNQRARDFTLQARNYAALSASDAGVGPVPLSAEATANGLTIIVTFDEDINVNFFQRQRAALTVDGALVDLVNSDRVSGDSKSLSLGVQPDSPIEAGQTVTVSYTDPTPANDPLGPIKDLDGNDAASFTDFPVTNNSTVPAGSLAPPEPLTAAFEDLPTSHGGAAFTVELAFSEELAVTEAQVRAGLAVTGGTLGAVAQSESGENRRWDVTVTPDDEATAVTLTLAPKESCETEHAICAADGRGLAEAVEVRIEGRPPVTVTGVAVTSTPGDNGTWDAGETVEAQVRFSHQVTVVPPGKGPVLTVLLDGAAREAAYHGGRGTDTLTFRHTVTDADAGARRARVAANGLDLAGTVLAHSGGRKVEIGFDVAPYVTGVALVADASDDRAWTPGESVEARLTFSEAVTVEGGTPTLGASAGGEAMTLAYASGSGSAVLVFSRAVTDSDGSLSQVAVTADSLALGGATIVSAASGLAAELDHDGTEPTEPAQALQDGEADALTASFADLPDSHGGEPFTLRLRFGEELPIGYATLRDAALAAAGGQVSAVRRTTAGSNLEWTVTVTPEGGAGDVTVTLAARACTETGAVCTTDGRGLAADVTAVVPAAVSAATPFQVRLEDLPAEHDGSGEFAFRVVFNKKPKLVYTYTRFRDETLRVARGGTALAPKVRRLNPPYNDRWAVTVSPGGNADVTVSVGPFAGCSDTGAMCTSEDEVLANAVTATVLGPPGLSVADARVYEAAGATLDFVVTLARASSATVTVDYATADDTATANEDYEPRSGTLTFAAGETEKTVAVPVLQDGHDEGEETLTLTLSNPRGGNAWLSDATAVGTIENSDAMPRAWLARFGRTVAEQVIEAVDGRFGTQRHAGARVSFAGVALDGAPDEEREASERREAERHLERLSDWLTGEADDDDANAQYSRAITGRDLLTGSSFTLTAGTPEGGHAALWGRGAVSRFDGREGELSLEGEVTSAMLGADWTREVATLGLMLTHSRGEGSYRGEGEGEVESTLTGLYPYGRYALAERVSLWGVAGYGAGELLLTPSGAATLTTDMSLVMGAVGVRGVAVEAPADGGLALSVTSDAMAVRTRSDAVRGSAGGNLAAAEADVTRLRVGLEGSWRGIGADGGPTLVPTAQIGLRHDGGDAETGFGVDVGAGLAWASPGGGLSGEVHARGLLTHEAGGFGDRGIAGSLAWDPAPDSERGFSLTIAQSMGAQASGGMHALLGQRHLERLSAADGEDALENRRLDLRLGYGLGVFGDRFTATPQAGLGLSNGHRELSLGWRLGLARNGPVSMELGLTGTRSETTGDDGDAVNALMLRGAVRW